MDDPIVLAAVQTTCAVLGLAFTVFQVVVIIRRRLRNRRRVTGKTVRAQEASEPKIDLSGMTSASRSLRILTAGAVLYVLVAAYVALVAEAFRIGDVSSTVGRVLVTVGVGFLVLWTLGKGKGATESAILFLTVLQLAGELTPPWLPWKWYEAGFIPIAVLVIFGYFSGWPWRQAGLIAYAVFFCTVFRHPQEALVCALMGLILTFGSPKPDRWKVWLFAISAFSVFAVAMTMNTINRWTISFWAFPDGDRYGQAWQRDRYWDALANAHLWGTSSIGLGWAYDLDGLAWPVTLIMRWGWIPAGAVIAVLLAWLVGLTIASSRLTERRLPALTLSIGALVFYVANVMVIAGALPMFGIVAIGFDGPIGMAAGAVWILFTVSFIAKRPILLARRAAPVIEDPVPIRPMPLSYLDSWRIYLRVVEPPDPSLIKYTPLKWTLLYLGLADFEDVPPERRTPSSATGKAELRGDKPRDRAQSDESPSR